MRIGYGYDCHQFAEGNHVMIGGIKLNHHKGIKAHSDGDVLLHAIGDALLGAAALGDLGRHFPDKDPQYRNISSSELIYNIVQQVNAKSYKIGNVDATVITERPKLQPHISAMCQHIAKLLNITIDDVNIKATTNEKMGWLGREEGIAAQAALLLFKKR